MLINKTKQTNKLECDKANRKKATKEKAHKTHKDAETHMFSHIEIP